MRILRADIAAFDARGHGANVDDLARQRHIERVGALAGNRDRDARAGLAFDAVDRLGHVQANDAFAIDFGLYADLVPPAESLPATRDPWGNWQQLRTDTEFAPVLDVAALQKYR